jgi:CheY-like chemotaxis protein
VILIVDDSADRATVIKHRLRKEGYNAHSLRSGLEALAYLEYVTPKVILLDYAMPDMDGLEFLQKVQSVPNREKIAIILFTAMYDERVW